MFIGKEEWILLLKLKLSIKLYSSKQYIQQYKVKLNITNLYISIITSGTFMSCLKF